MTCFDRTDDIAFSGSKSKNDVPSKLKTKISVTVFWQKISIQVNDADMHGIMNLIYLRTNFRLGQFIY